MNIAQLVLKVLGAKVAYRLGRSLYMQARGDIANNMETNGELMLQQSVIDSIKKYSRGKLVFFDVGANIGDWSSAMLTSCRLSNCHSFDIYVFEPVPSTAKALKKRLGDNKYVHYELFALSSKNGTDVIYVSDELAGTNSLHCENIDSPPSSTSIDKITASQFCALNNIDSIDLFKSDTEGHDMEVIIGALSLLKEGKIAVFQFEYNHRWIFSRHYIKDVFDIIEGLPYCLGKVCSDHIEVYDRWHPEHERFFEANYVLLRDDAVSWFETRECNLDENVTLAVVNS